MKDLWRVVKIVGAGLLLLAMLAGLGYGGYRFGKRSNQNRIADLSTELSKSEETVELQKGLYSRKVKEIEDLTSLLDTRRAEVAALRKHLEETQAKLLITEQISLRWKKAFEDALKAVQTEEPPEEPGGVPRKKVTFEGMLGPVKASGHTLTDPPEAHLKLEQIVPLILTMNMVQNKDGTWSTFVTSSDENIDVKIDLAGVNPLVLSEKWYQRLWIEANAIFIGEPAGTIGLSYHGDRYSFGVDCSAWQTGSGCGVRGGFRLFK